MGTDFERQIEEKGRRKLALLVEYEGTRYCGFQLQRGAPTIQGELEAALKGLTGEEIRVRGASRTDSGAHAKGQVVDFITRAEYRAQTFVNALNWYLPEDIKVRGGCEAPLNFSARKDATARLYRYTVLNSPWPSPLHRWTTYQVAWPLDIQKMQKAAQAVLGTHDFSPLAAKLPPERSGVRTVHRWKIDTKGEMVYIDAEANGFLPRQIRCTNGLLVEIGLGKAEVGALKDVLDGKMSGADNRPALPARGLCLVRVKYMHPLFTNEEADET